MTRVLLLLGILLVVGGLGLLGFAGLSGNSDTLVVEDQSSPSGSPSGEGSASRPLTSTSRRPVSTTTRDEGTTSTSTTTPQTPSTTSTTTTSSTLAAAPRVVIAWQPSHQDDTGGAGWHEYLICEDISRRAMALLEGSEVKSVLAWETSMGLTGSNNTGSNAPAFDSEIRQANEAGADYFISIHNDGGAPSGVLGMFFSGDTRSQVYAERFAASVSELTGLPYRGVRGHELYSLDQQRNLAPIRILLEIGDNQKDRAFLENPDNRQLIAEALARVARDLPKP